MGEVARPGLKQLVAPRDGAAEQVGMGEVARPGLKLPIPRCTVMTVTGWNGRGGPSGFETRRAGAAWRMALDSWNGRGGPSGFETG